MSIRLPKRKRNRIKYASQDYTHLRSIGTEKSSLILNQSDKGKLLEPSARKKKKSGSRSRRQKSVFVASKESTNNSESRNHGSSKKRGKRSSKKDDGHDTEIARLNEIIVVLRKENEILKAENGEFSRKFQMMKEIYSEVNGTTGKKNKSRRKDFEELLSGSSDKREDGSKNERSGNHLKPGKRKNSLKKSKRRSSKNPSDPPTGKKRSNSVKKYSTKISETQTQTSGSRQGSNAASESLPAISPVVFNIPITDVELDDDHIPVFMKKIITELKERGLDIEGILRISGASHDIKTYQNELDCGETEIDFTVISVHTLAGLLKSFFRLLPAPIIPPLYNAQIPLLISDLKEGKKREMDIIQELKFVVYSLPEPNFSIYQYLGQFLHEVWQHEESNKMNLSNILTCVCPSIRTAPALIYYTIKFNEFFLIEDATLSETQITESENVLDFVNNN